MEQGEAFGFSLLEFGVPRCDSSVVDNEYTLLGKILRIVADKDLRPCFFQVLGDGTFLLVAPAHSKAFFQKDSREGAHPDTADRDEVIVLLHELSYVNSVSRREKRVDLAEFSSNREIASRICLRPVS